MNYKRLILIAIVCFTQVAIAQTDTTYWKKGGSLGLNFNQATLSNWAAGGASSVSGAGYLTVIADYAKGDTYWKNSFEIGYGLLKEKGRAQQKTEDKIILTSSYGKQLSQSNDKWFYSASLDFRTQFAEGFADGDNDQYISRFLAPAYLLTSAGFNWKPSEYFSVKFGVLSGKMTIVNDDTLAARGAFGVDPGEKIRMELGGTITANFNKEIFENGQFISNLILFSNYLEYPERIDVNWENTLNMKINSVLSANLYNQLIYDYDIRFDVVGENGEITTEDRVQFKNILGLGLTYKFGGSRG